jgi:hypothetical protein
MECFSPAAGNKARMSALKLLFNIQLVVITIATGNAKNIHSRREEV